MPRALVYATRNGAENRSRAEAQRRGCGAPGQVTQLWWHVAEGDDGQWGVVLMNDDKEDGNLSSADRARLKAAFKLKPVPNPHR